MDINELPYEVQDIIYDLVDPERTDSLDELLHDETGTNWGTGNWVSTRRIVKAIAEAYARGENS